MKANKNIYPVISSAIKYYTIEDLLKIAPLDNETLEETLISITPNKVGLPGAQAVVTKSDNPNFAVMVKVARMNWVDEETHAQINEEVYDVPYVGAWRRALRFGDVNGKPRGLFMRATTDGLEISVTDYGTKDGGDGLIYLELDSAHPTLYFWDDINEEDYSHALTLERAHINNLEDDDESEDCDCLTDRTVSK